MPFILISPASIFKDVIGENTVMNSCDQKDARKINPQHPQIVTKRQNGLLAVQPLKSHNVVSSWYWAEFLFPESREGKEKRRYSLLVLWMESFRSTNRLSYTETMAHPAALALLLSLPILRLSICLWAETHGTSCSTQRTSQKFTSCSSALLLHTSPIPRTCISSALYA